MASHTVTDEHLSGATAVHTRIRRVQSVTERVGEAAWKRGNRSLKALLIVGDLCSVVLAWWGAAMIAAAGAQNLQPHLMAGVGGAVATAAALHHQRLHLARISNQRMLEAAGILRAGMAGAIGIGVTRPVMGLPFDPVHVAAYGLAAGGLLLAFRSLYRTWLGSRRRAGAHVRTVVIVGDNEEATEFVELVTDHPELGLRVAGVLGDGPERAAAPRLGTVGDAVRVTRSLRVSGVVVVASALAAPQLHDVTRDLLAAGVHVHVSSGLAGISRTRIRPVALAHESLLYLEPSPYRTWQIPAKRAIDIASSTAALLLTSPLWVVAAALIKLDSPGPVLFRQERVGLHGRRFRVLKFRTMVTDAEWTLASLQARNERSGGPLFKMTADPRVTRIGRVLRATSLDELPQLLNVLAGDMSMVGPRPALETEVERFDDELRARLRVKPGITGLWQIEARDHPSFRPYRRLDLYYVENWSLTLDLLIFLGTFTSVGARIVRYVVPALRVETAMAPS